MTTSLANDFAVVRLKKKVRELFITVIFPAMNLFFLTVFH